MRPAAQHFVKCVNVMLYIEPDLNPLQSLGSAYYILSHFLYALVFVGTIYPS